MAKKGAEKLWARQGQAVQDEAGKVGSRLFHEELITAEVAGAGGAAARSSMTSLLGGGLQIDAVQLFVFETDGVRHVYVQPYSGLAALPGEHHAVLLGSVPAVMSLAKGFLSTAWEPSKDTTARAWTADTGLDRLTKAFKWEWKVGAGKINLDWVAQLRPVGANATHIAMQAGRYGGLATYKVGFDVFVRFMQAAQSGQRASAGTEAPFAHPTRYGDVALPLLLEMAV